MGMNMTKAEAAMVAPVIATYSADPEFVKMIRKSEFSYKQSPNNKVDFSVRAVTSDVDELADCDAMIYDLDQAEGDVLRAKEDILHLKLNSLSRPLILVGQKALMKTLLETEKVNHLVSKTMAKPVVSSQLEMVVNASVKGRAGLLAATKAPKRNHTLFAFGSSFFAIILTVLTIMTFSTSSDNADTAAPNNVASISSKN